MTAVVVLVEQSEIDRVLGLPRRPPVDCEREPGARRWSPATQALVEVMTEKFSRPRISCGCRDRKVQKLSGTRLLVFHTSRKDQPPPLPLEIGVDEFCHDNQHDRHVVEKVRGLQIGNTVDLKGLGHQACLTELNPVQSWILFEAPRTNGAFGMVSVGGGKTIAGILTALALPDARMVALLAKPDQRIHYKNAYLALREHFRVPSIVFDKDSTEGFHVTGTPVIHFLPYSLLSNPKSTDLLERMEFDTIIADECHLLSNRTSSRTTRFLRLMTRRGNVRFFCWSGSLVKRTLKDASHLAAHSLGLGSPYPILPAEVDKWSAVIDPSFNPDLSTDTARRLYRVFANTDLSALENVNALKSMLGDQQAVREGFRDWSVMTPGVISTRSSPVTSSLTFRERKAPKIPQVVLDALTEVRMRWVRPDGEELVEALDKARCAREVGSGYFYRWVYPKGEPPEVIEDWFAKRKAYHRELRKKLLMGEMHLDSPKLCWDAAERAWQETRYRGNLPVWPAESWKDWNAVKDLVQPESRAVWIDDYLARDAAEWARENKGVVWCLSSAFGRRVAELAGLNYHGGGPNAEANILAEDGSRSIIASIKAHGTGRDGLQHKFSKQLVAESPSSGDVWEQLLGRLVRIGQAEDTVETEVYVHVEESREAMRKALDLAEYIEATTPNRQLILAADFEFEV